MNNYNKLKADERTPMDADKVWWVINISGEPHSLGLLFCHIQWQTLLFLSIWWLSDVINQRRSDYPFIKPFSGIDITATMVKSCNSFWSRNIFELAKIQIYNKEKIIISEELNYNIYNRTLWLKRYHHILKITTQDYSTLFSSIKH